MTSCYGATTRHDTDTASQEYTATPTLTRFATVRGLLKHKTTSPATPGQDIKDTHNQRHRHRATKTHNPQTDTSRDNTHTHIHHHELPTTGAKENQNQVPENLPMYGVRRLQNDLHPVGASGSTHSKTHGRTAVPMPLRQDVFASR